MGIFNKRFDWRIRAGTPHQLERFLKIRKTSAGRARAGQLAPEMKNPLGRRNQSGLNTKQDEEIMTQSAIPAQELVKRLCNDRKIKGTSPFNDPKKFSELRRVVDQLPIIRDLSNKNLSGWELDIDTEDAA